MLKQCMHLYVYFKDFGVLHSIVKHVEISPCGGFSQAATHIILNPIPVTFSSLHYESRITAITPCI